MSYLRNFFKLFVLLLITLEPPAMLIYFLWPSIILLMPFMQRIALVMVDLFAVIGLQWAGWQWRGVLSWDKVSARLQRGRSRQQCEYVAWGSNGPMPIDWPVPVLPGAFRISAPPSNKRIHQTEKPLALMQELVHMCEPGGIILDSFTGSGSTLEAARLEGDSSIGIEVVREIVEVARKRVERFLV